MACVDGHVECSEDAAASLARPATGSGWNSTADRYSAIEDFYFLFLVFGF